MATNIFINLWRNTYICNDVKWSEYTSAVFNDDTAALEEIAFGRSGWEYIGTYVHEPSIGKCEVISLISASAE